MIKRLLTAALTVIMLGGATAMAGSAPRKTRAGGASSAVTTVCTGPNGEWIKRGKSGIIVAGTLRGNELPAPNGLIPKPLGTQTSRTVAFTDLDRNGHMNNTRCLDWIADLLPSRFHESHTVTDFTVCYLAEAREQQELRLNWDMSDGCTLQVDATTGAGEESHRVFSAKLYFDDNGVL